MNTISLLKIVTAYADVFSVTIVGSLFLKLNAVDITDGWSLLLSFRSLSLSSEASSSWSESLWGLKKNYVINLIFNCQCQTLILQVQKEPERQDVPTEVAIKRPPMVLVKSCLNSEQVIWMRPNYIEHWYWEKWP